MAIGDGHELDGTHASLEVFGGQAVDAASAGLRQHALEGFERTGDGNDVAGDAEVCGERARIGQ